MVQKILNRYRLKKALLHEAKRTPNRFDDALFTWTAPLRKTHDKGVIWLTVMTAGVGVLIWYAISTHNWIFAGAMIIAIVAYAVDHFTETPTVETKISAFGVKVGEHIIPFSSMRGFWILYHPPFFGEIHFHTSRKVMNDIVVQLGDQDPVRLREFLTRHIPEWEGKDQGLIEICTHILKL